MVQNSQLKDENDQLVINADEEIKRMSQFIENYTVDIEQNKRELEAEYEAKL